METLKKFMVEAGEALIVAISVAVSFSIFIAAVFWFINASEQRGEPPFVLAQFSATLGGLVLVGAFIRGANATLRLQLTWIARLFIIAAVAFAVLGLLLPMEVSALFLTIMLGASFYIASFSFSVAIGWLVLSLPRLSLREEKI